MISYIRKLKNREIKKWLKQKYIKEKLQQKQIAKLCNVNRNTVHEWLIFFKITLWPKGETRKKKPKKIINLKVGDRYRARDIGLEKYRKATLLEWIECPICKEKRWVKVEHNKVIALYCHKCGGAKKEGVISKQGYREIWTPPTSPFAKMRNARGRIAEHRLIMAKYLNRCLKTYEVVHHIDHDKLNNDITNLKFIPSNGPHLAITILENKVKRLKEKNQLLKEKINELKAKIMGYKNTSAGIQK